MCKFWNTGIQTHYIFYCSKGWKENECSKRKLDDIYLVVYELIIWSDIIFFWKCIKNIDKIGEVVYINNVCEFGFSVSKP